MADRYNARLGEYELEMETISDSFPSAIIKHKYPYVNGADLENMGQDEHTITVRCYFLNESYDLHFDLLKVLEKRERLEFLHPFYGLMTGDVENITVRHDDRKETAEIDLTFIEQLRGKIEPLSSSDIASETEAIFEEAMEEQTAAAVSAMTSAVGAEAAGMAAQALDPGLGILAQFTSITGAARAYVKKVDKLVATLEGTLATIANPANSLISTIDYAANLPGRMLGSVAATMERYSELYKTIATAPDQFVRSFTNGMAELEASLDITTSGGIYSAAEAAAADSMLTQIRSAAALRIGLDVAYFYADDQEKRREVKKQEGSESFDSAGRYVKTAALPDLLTVDDIEKSLAAAREYMQTLIDRDRTLQSLKSLALALQEHAWQIKLESEKLVTVTVDNALPLHLVCHMNGLPYNYAPRILSVNNIQNPNFVTGEIKVYAK